MQSQILTAAQDVRIWAEERALRELFPADLCGLCARSSAMLYILLKQRGYSPQIIYSDYVHVFIHVENHLIDLTATQFFNTNFIPIFIRPINNEESASQYINSKVFNNLFQFIRFQHKKEWIKKEVFSKRDITSFNKMKASGRYAAIHNKNIL